MSSEPEVAQPGEMPLSTLVEEGRRMIAAADAAGVTLRITGGVGVALCCPSAASPPLKRVYADLDVVGHAKERRGIVDLVMTLGYQPDQAFNALNGARRLFFWDRTNSRQLDVFLDRVEMCHLIDLGRRLGVPGPALAPADLLLMKLQVVETNDKDLVDIITILVDHELADGTGDGVEVGYIADLCANDWGLWRTVTMVAQRADDHAQAIEGLARRTHVHDQVQRLLAALEAAPKSTRWKLRSRIGDRKRWYELPEESH